MTASTFFIGSASVVGILISVIFLSCEKKDTGFILKTNTCALSASEAGFILSAFPETNRVVYAMTTGDRFPLSLKAKKTVWALLSESEYFQASNTVKRVVEALVFTDDLATPDLSFSFFPDGFVDAGDKMFFVGENGIKIIKILKEEYNQVEVRVNTGP
jgi:hypothetical protein